MTAELLLREFDRVGDASLDRLREFVLRLAMEGRLSEGLISSEESGIDTVKRLRDLKSSSSRSHKPQPNRVESGFSPQHWPVSWGVAAIADVSDLATGATPNSGRPDYYGGPIKWLRSGDVSKRVITDCDGRITQSGLDSSNCKLIPADCVLIALNGQGKTRGSVAILRTEAACNQSLVAIMPLDRSALLPEFLYWNLRSRYWAIRRLTGEEGDRRGLNMKLIGALVIPVPSPTEQRRIVAKVDELMALCDQLEAAQKESELQRDALRSVSLHRLTSADVVANEATDVQFFLKTSPRLITKPEHVAAVQQSILDLAVRGRLVPQGDGWETSSIDDLASMVTSGSRGWAEYYAPTGAKFVRAQNIRFGKLLLDDLAHVRLPPRVEGTRTQVAVGDILIVITGAGVTNPAILDVELGEAYVSQHVGLVKLENKDYGRWTLLCLMAPAGARAELVRRAYGSGKPGLNLDNIRSLSIPLPPLAEQIRIVAKVDELMTLCDELEAALASAQYERGRLLECLLQEILDEGARLRSNTESMVVAG